MKDNLYIVAIYSATVMVTDRSLRSLVMPDGQVGFVGNEVAKAREFKHWVTNDVLPKIRQTGGYMTHDTMMQMMQQPEQVVLLCRK